MTDLGWNEHRAPQGRTRFRLSELLESRELLFFFALRDVKVRYKQAMLGAAWIGIQPLVGAITFTILFGELVGVELEDDAPYFPFAFAGYAAWTYVSGAILVGTASLVSNADLLTKVAFPRIVVPTAALLPGILDFAVTALLVLVAAIAMGSGVSIGGLLLALPAGLVLLVLASAGPVLFFSSLTVRYRDANSIVGFGLQVVLFASPVAYPPELVPDAWRTLYYVNPLAGAIGLVRSGLSATPLPEWHHLGLSACMAVALTTFGLWWFRRAEPEFADVV